MNHKSQRMHVVLAIPFGLKESLNFFFLVHIGPDKTEILAKRGFRFVDPYVKKTILNLNGSVWHVKPESVKASTVSGDSMVTHRVRLVLEFLILRFVHKREVRS